MKCLPVTEDLARWYCRALALLIKYDDVSSVYSLQASERTFVLHGGNVSVFMLATYHQDGRNILLSLVFHSYQFGLEGE